jgi:hypothetical protein
VTTHLDPSEPVTGGGYLVASGRTNAGTGSSEMPGPLPGAAHPPRRLAVGYVRLRPDADAAERGQVTAQVVEFAARSGLDLVGIYTDRHSYRRSAFGELLQALCDPDVNAVIIPTPEHLSEFDGMYQAMRALIEIETGADVLVMAQNSEATS